ncbi:MAG: hypothetical protein WC718_11385 [Phycisphaerales bacterium]|jgi:uncharacterized lipoprotein YmbA
MRTGSNRSLKPVLVLALGALAALGGCSSSSKSAQVYTFDASASGNFIAADALGSRMMRSETYRQAMAGQRNNNLASAHD